MNTNRIHENATLGLKTIAKVAINLKLPRVVTIQIKAWF